MTKFRFKDPRQGTGIYYVLKIRRSYGNLTILEYSKDPNSLYSRGIVFAQQVEIIND